MKSIKTFAATFAAGAAITAASLLTVAAPASAATGPAVQNAGNHTAVQRPAGAPGQRPAPARAAVEPHSSEKPEQKVAELKQQRQQRQQQAGQGGDPGGYLPNPPVVTPEG